MAGARLRAALLSAALIALSGATEPRRCYWCGPLAEQVHRSRRSAPCGVSAPVTACEPGYEYCAVVATSPLPAYIHTGQGDGARRCYWCGLLAEQVHRSRRFAPCGVSAPVTACEPGYEYCAVVATSPRESPPIYTRDRATEPRRCYWCGPLAEQVHRSRRSAPCGVSAPVTACEPGYEYCAVVATSPPRVESRYCVKIYQDECYPLFCNSTKTWKMTCPCRGDLCNGPNTQRETEAFALLPKLVAKTHNARIKKRTAVASPHLIKHERKTRIIGNGDTANISEANASAKLIVNENDVNLNPDADAIQPGEMQSDQPTNIVVEHHDDDSKENAENLDNKDNGKSTPPDNHLIEIEIHVSDPTDESMTIKDNEAPCTNSDISSTSEPDKPEEVIETEKHEAILITTIAETTEITVKSNENTNVVQSDEPTQTTAAMQQDIVTVKITSESIPELPAIATEVMPSDEAPKAVDEMQNDAPVINPIDSVQTMKTTEEAKVVETSTMKIVKPSEGIPTAEALQQNGNPTSVTEKSTAVPTTEATTTITMTQENMMKVTTTPASRRKNSATQITFSYMLFVSCIVYL